MCSHLYLINTLLENMIFHKDFSFKGKSSTMYSKNLHGRSLVHLVPVQRLSVNNVRGHNFCQPPPFSSNSPSGSFFNRRAAWIIKLIWLKFIGAPTNLGVDPISYPVNYFWPLDTHFGFQNLYKLKTFRQQLTHLRDDKLTSTYIKKAK